MQGTNFFILKIHTKILPQLLNLEKIPKTALQGPEISVRIKDVEVSIANKIIPNELVEVIPYHLLGLFLESQNNANRNFVHEI